jgi:hypothetical protein
MQDLFHDPAIPQSQTPHHPDSCGERNARLLQGALVTHPREISAVIRLFFDTPRYSALSQGLARREAIDKIYHGGRVNNPQHTNTSA